MSFIDTAYIYSEKVGKGSQSSATTPEKKVSCEISRPGAKIQYTARAANYTAERQIVMWSDEYSGENRVRIGNERYRIELVGAAKNRLHIKLMLAKEG